jgi:hypothetical protein|tara:strand:- start:827 stop:976 length:150 start_codon:yes stop_codon:yes gene_type:complete
MIKERIKKSVKKANKCREYMQNTSIALILALLIVAKAQYDAKKSYKKHS